MTVPSIGFAVAFQRSVEMVRCAASFDDRARKIARAVASVLQEAEIDFAILGQQELCNGDPARRAGSEYLFQMLAEQNVETMNGAGVTKVLASQTGWVACIHDSPPP